MRILQKCRILFEMRERFLIKCNTQEIMSGITIWGKEHLNSPAIIMAGLK